MTYNYLCVYIVSWNTKDYFSLWNMGSIESIVFWIFLYIATFIERDYYKMAEDQLVVLSYHFTDCRQRQWRHININLFRSKKTWRGERVQKNVIWKIPSPISLWYKKSSVGLIKQRTTEYWRCDPHEEESKFNYSYNRTFLQTFMYNSSCLKY